MHSFRTKETLAKYMDHIARKTEAEKKQCPLCEETSLHTFTHWRIIPNAFPYDRIAETNHMILSNRHVTETELTEEEKNELFEIKRTYIDENYEYIFENPHYRSTLPAHFHLHLIIAKEIK